MSDDLRYPIGIFTPPATATAEDRARWIDELAAAPARMRDAVAGLSDAQLDTPYRPGGWTIRQVVHHVPDSHMNGYIRHVLALTEHDPIIRPYDQDAWVALPFSRTGQIEASLAMLEQVHARWVAVLRAMSEADFERAYVHPDHGRRVPLREHLAHYAWHGKHHVAHVTGVRQREGW